MPSMQTLASRDFLFGFFLFTLGGVDTAKAITKSSNQPSLDFSNEILSSTVQIRVYDPENTYFSYGLGSLFVLQGTEFVLTHSHWPNLFPESRVQFLDWQNSIIGEVSGKVLMDLIQYQDAGSLIVAAPLNLCCPTPLSKMDFALSQNEQVAVAHYDSPGLSKIKISTARILQVDGDGIPIYAITMLGGDQSDVGDSGAGIWHDGKLVANLWSVILENPPVEQWEAFQVIYVARFPDDFYKLPLQGLQPFYLSD